MDFEEATKIIIGTIGSLGGVILLLNRFGLLHFGKKREELTKMVTNLCPGHQMIHDTQIKNIELHKQHAAELLNGKKEFTRIQKDIKQLCIGVAILLDRSGGRPKEFADGEGGGKGK